MPISLEQFRAAIEKLENGAELLEFHTAQVMAEKNRGIDTAKVKNHENQRLKAFQKAFEKLGFDKDDTEIDGFVESLVAKMDETANKGNTQFTELQKTLTKLQKDFDKTQKELGTEREQKTQLEKQNRQRTIESKLLPKLQEDFYGANFIVKALLSDGAVDLDESGEVVFKKGDQVLSMADGLKTIAEQNTDARKNKQTGGAGSSASTQKNSPKYSLEQIKAMSPEQMKVNISDVNDSMRQLSVAAK